MTNLNAGNRKIFWFLTFVLMLGSFGVYYYVNINKSSKGIDNELGTCKTPEEAFNETQKALNLISTNINSGIESAAYLKEYEITKNKVFKKRK